MTSTPMAIRISSPVSATDPMRAELSSTRTPPASRVGRPRGLSARLAERSMAHPFKVLVVDDEKNIRATLGVCLEGLGCRVTPAASAPAAREWAARQPFDLAFVDFPDPNNFSLGKLYTTRFYRLLHGTPPVGGTAGAAVRGGCKLPVHPEGPFVLAGGAEYGRIYDLISGHSDTCVTGIGPAAGRTPSSRAGLCARFQAR